MDRVAWSKFGDKTGKDQIDMDLMKDLEFPNPSTGKSTKDLSGEKEVRLSLWSTFRRGK